MALLDSLDLPALDLTALDLPVTLLKAELERLTKERNSLSPSDPQRNELNRKITEVWQELKDAKTVRADAVSAALLPSFREACDKALAKAADLRSSLRGIEEVNRQLRDLGAREERLPEPLVDTLTTVVRLLAKANPPWPARGQGQG